MTRPLPNVFFAAVLLVAAAPKIIGMANAPSEPYFSRCEVDARGATREGRSAFGAPQGAKRSVQELSPVTPGLLAFGLGAEGWRGSPALGTRNTKALACPSAAKPRADRP